MEEYRILKDKLILLIKENPNKELQKLLKELNSINVGNNLINKRPFMRFVNFIRRNKKTEDFEISDIDKQKIKEIKIKVSKIYIENSIKSLYERNDSLSEQLVANIKNEERFNTCLQYDENSQSYKLYPIDVEEEVWKNRYIEELCNIVYDYFSTDKTDKELFEIRNEEYKKRYKKLEQDFMEKDFKPYYGSPNFIVKRSEYINHCIQRIIDSKNVSDDLKINSIKLLPEVRNDYNEMLKIYSKSGDNMDKNTYEEMERLYLKIRDVEDILSKDVEQVWKEFLTDPRDYKEGDRFAFFAHTLTQGVVEPQKLNKVCCTLITDKSMPIIDGKYGYIFPMDMRTMGTMCLEDSGSWSISKKRFWEQKLAFDWQFAEESGFPGEKVFYEEEKISKLILPEDMENAIIQRNEKYNGEPLNYNQYTAYSECYMIKTSDTDLMPISFFTKYGQNQKMIEDLQKENPNLPSKSITIDLDMYREQIGLRPLKEKIHETEDMEYEDV